jgi:hypothetical protein
VGKPEGKRSLGNQDVVVDDIRMVVRDIQWGSTDWIDLAQKRDQWRALVNKVMNLRTP